MRRTSVRSILVLRASLVLAFISLESLSTLSIEPFREIKLPALRIQGKAAKAHTQGLELLSDRFYVTARRDDVQPRRALLARTAIGRIDWDVWDITPVDAQGNLTALDHPGGMQSDGKHLWIPLSESKRQGGSLVRRYPIASLIHGQPLKHDFEFSINDHIGAVAVSAERGILLGASWDTESVYIWDLAGRLHQTFTNVELGYRGIGIIAAREANGPGRRTGLTVQDWKWVGDRLFASGLFRAAEADPNAPQSQVLSFTDFLEPRFQRITIPLPKLHGTELSREGMAISNGTAYFLPEDLTSTNRVFHLPLQDLMNLAQRTSRN